MEEAGRVRGVSKLVQVDGRMRKVLISSGELANHSLGNRWPKVIMQACIAAVDLEALFGVWLRSSCFNGCSGLHALGAAFPAMRGADCARSSFVRSNPCISEQSESSWPHRRLSERAIGQSSRLHWKGHLECAEYSVLTSTFAPIKKIDLRGLR